MSSSSSHPIIIAGEPILRCQNTLGEGPLWDSERGVVNWVDIDKGEIHTFNPETEEHSFESYGQRIGSIALRLSHPGSFIAGVERSICFTDPSNPGKLIPFVSPIPDPLEDGTYGKVDRFNDGVVDKKGRFVTGTMSQEKGGAQLYSISPNHTSTLLLSSVSCSNGTGWSPDSSLLYYVDSGEEASIHLFDYDLETGGISNRREFAKDTFGDGGTFDGLTMDEEGCVWVARWKSSRVVKYNPDGSIGLEIRFPKAANITCCIFGGKDMNELYVTTASCLASGEGELVEKFPEGGDLYRIKIEGTRGVEKFKFGG